MPDHSTFLICANDAASFACITDVDTNCACADAGAHLESEYAETQVESHTVSELVTPALYIQPLDATHYVVFNPLGEAGPVVLNQHALGLLEAFATTRTPEQVAQIYIDAADCLAAVELLHALHLLQAPGTHRRYRSSDPETLVVWLHTTNACNLRCTYCYIDKTDEAMDEATGYASVDAVFKTAQQHGYKSVKLKYAGGEATLNFGLVTKLHTYARTLSQQTGIALKGVVLSNGVGLTKAMLDFIHTSGMTLSISLDGLGHSHDTQRVFVNGRGSAQVVVRSIERAIAHGVYPHLSMTVTAHNADEIADAVAFALERNLLFNLNFYRDHNETLAAEEHRAEDAALITGIEKAFAAIERNLPQHSLLSSLVDRANFASVHETACNAGKSYLVIDQFGRISRCQMEIERSVTDIYAADPLTEIRLYDSGFQSVGVDEKSGCRECEWRYWCAGGCPALTYKVTGRNDVKSPYCNVYKSLYPSLLQLEGKRLLKRHTLQKA
ncbi:SPASM domain-containing protein [bacterium]|nr:SPASM domain-containing protein [bacterium]